MGGLKTATGLLPGFFMRRGMTLMLTLMCVRNFDATEKGQSLPVEV